MEIQKMKSIIEAILFAAGRIVDEEELVLALEEDKKQIEEIIKSMQEEYKTRGIEIIKVNNGYQLCSKKEYNRVKNYDYRDSLGDFQKQQNIRSMSLDEMNDYEDL